MSLPHDAASEQWADEFVREHGRSVLLNLGASKPRKLWPAERFGELAREIERECSAHGTFTGSAGDATLAARARDRARFIDASCGQKWTDLTGQTSLLQLAALQRRSLAVVTCDAGPMHMAVAVGARVVALFGPGEPRRTGPYDHLGSVVRRNADGSPASMDLDHDLRTDDIDVEHVLEKLRPWNSILRSQNAIPWSRSQLDP